MEISLGMGSKLEAAVEQLVSHLMSLFAVAMNLPAARPSTGGMLRQVCFSLGTSVSAGFFVDVCRHL